MFTEFINVDGILHPEGFERLKIDLEYTENQRPIVAQIWGTDPQKFEKAAQLMVSLGFDGIDINMGCPQDKEIGIGACAALIRTPELASEIIEATIKGARLQSPLAPANGGQAGGLPVSVKTRLGYSKADEMEGWVSHLLKHNIAALTLHARTKQEKSKVPAQWEKVKEAVILRDKIQESRSKGDRTLIIGNGDVKSREEGLKRVTETGCDGIMIARGAFGFPWMFREDNHQPSVKERLTVALEHAKLFQEKLGEHKSFFIMRKHFKAYATGFEGAAELRAKLLETKNTAEVESIVNDFLQSIK
jgi:tRNA-dihydrouridine synthase